MSSFEWSPEAVTLAGQLSQALNATDAGEAQAILAAAAALSPGSVPPAAIALVGSVVSIAVIVAVVGLAVLFFRSPRKTWSSTSMLWGTVTLLVGACQFARIASIATLRSFAFASPSSSLPSVFSLFVLATASVATAYLTSRHACSSSTTLKSSRSLRLAIFGLADAGLLACLAYFIAEALTSTRPLVEALDARLTDAFPGAVETTLHGYVVSNAVKLAMLGVALLAIATMEVLVHRSLAHAITEASSRVETAGDLAASRISRPIPSLLRSSSYFSNTGVASRGAISLPGAFSPELDVKMPAPPPTPVEPSTEAEPSIRIVFPPSAATISRSSTSQSWTTMTTLVDGDDDLRMTKKARSASALGIAYPAALPPSPTDSRTALPRRVSQRITSRRSSNLLSSANRRLEAVPPNDRLSVESLERWKQARVWTSRLVGVAGAAWTVLLGLGLLVSRDSAVSTPVAVGLAFGEAALAMLMAIVAFAIAWQTSYRRPSPKTSRGGAAGERVV